MSTILGEVTAFIHDMPDERLSVPLPGPYIERLRLLAKMEDRSLAKQAAWCLKNCVSQAIADGKLPPFTEGEETSDD